MIFFVGGLFLVLIISYNSDCYEFSFRDLGKWPVGGHFKAVGDVGHIINADFDTYNILDVRSKSILKEGFRNQVKNVFCCLIALFSSRTRNTQTARGFCVTFFHAFELIK